MKKLDSLKTKIHEIIFEADTPQGKAFDIVLLWVILISVFLAMIDSVKSIREQYEVLLHIAEWCVTIFFTIEYFLRLYSVKKSFQYAVSFFGIIDLLSILPTYLSLFIAGSHYLVVIRALRLLRIFRILKLTQYLNAAQLISSALVASRRKILVFLMTVVVVAVIIGSVMYVVEGEEHGFTDIPTSIYWTIVTLTTVGYGDISPKTSLGRIISVFVMILGYSIIAVPTGIVTAEISQASRQQRLNRACKGCGGEGHADDAVYCKYCAIKL